MGLEVGPEVVMKDLLLVVWLVLRWFVLFLWIPVEWEGSLSG